MMKECMDALKQQADACIEVHRITQEAHDQRDEVSQVSSGRKLDEASLLQKNVNKGYKMLNYKNIYPDRTQAVDTPVADRLRSVAEARKKLASQTKS